MNSAPHRRVGRRVSPDAWGTGALLTNVPPEMRGMTADPDADRKVNVLGFALVFDPFVPDAPGFSIRPAPGGAVDLEYRRRTDTDRLTYTVLQSTDLLDWAPVSGELFAETVVPRVGAPYETVTALQAAPLPSGPSYYRLLIESLEH